MGITYLRWFNDVYYPSGLSSFFMVFFMYSFGEVILMAFAIVLMVEGVGPMLFANKWQGLLQQISQQPVTQLRTMGGVLVTIGVVSLIYLF
jgi:uncharacterized protein YjeT (DUF2065 family)|tara:strand:- start:1223 stop:1495 length:273 start_codon:yes stop_codon:yes gene_type:complete